MAPAALRHEDYFRPVGKLLIDKERGAAENNTVAVCVAPELAASYSAGGGDLMVQVQMTHY